MKTLLLFGALVLSINAFSQVPNYVPANGLMAWFPFNGNANDESINTNDGTVNGATLTVDRFSSINSAYDFDGVDDHIVVSDNSNDDLDFGLNDYSISIWFNSQQSGVRTLIHKRRMGGPSGGTNFEGYTLWMKDDTLKGAIEDLTNNWGGISEEPVSIGDWHHVVFIRDVSDDSIRVYLDGALFGKGLDETTSTTATLDDLLIGEWRDYTNYNFDGKIDDIGMWNRILTDCEIQDLYNAQLNSTVFTATQNGTLLTADQTGATYQWLDCDDNDAEINGETNQSYTPAVTGNYSVEVTLNGCVDTSACMLVDYTGIEELINGSKELVKITDLMGRETTYKPNTPLLYIYSNGTVERVFKLEE